MTTLLEKTFDLPARCSIKRVTIRELNGKDERQALLAAKESGETLWLAMVRLSITQVDDQAIHTGSAPVDDWNTRTRNAVGQFFDYMNGVEDEEIAPLLAAAEKDGAIDEAIEKELNNDSENSTPSLSAVIDSSAGSKGATGSG